MVFVLDVLKEYCIFLLLVVFDSFAPLSLGILSWWCIHDSGPNLGNVLASLSDMTSSVDRRLDSS